VHTTRFAPSPTGLLHIGHAFAAITAHAVADGGPFLLRIEDLDPGRSRPEFEAAITEDLAWLGLTWEKPVLHQSTRFGAYRDALATLTDQGLTYPCFCTRKEIAAEIARASEAPHGADHALYPGLCRTLSAADRERRIAAGQAHVIRLDAAKAAARIAPLSFVEMGHGPHGEHGTITLSPSLLGDIVLGRKDIPAAYQALLRLPAPLYAHHRLILNEQGRKFSKREYNVTLRQLREQGVSSNEVRRRLDCP